VDIPNPLSELAQQESSPINLKVSTGDNRQQMLKQVNKPVGPCYLNEFLAQYSLPQENESEEQSEEENVEEEQINNKLDFNVFSNAIIRSELLCFFPENMLNPAINPTEDSSLNSQLVNSDNVECLNLLKIPHSEQLLNMFD